LSLSKYWFSNSVKAKAGLFANQFFIVEIFNPKDVSNSNTLSGVEF